MKALQARDLSVMLGRTQAVRQVTLSIRAGWTAIVGPNGAGKSTLLRALAGLQAPDAGSVWLDGQDLARLPLRERARAIAWLDQRGEPGGEMSVRDLVMLGRLPALGLFGTPSAADHARVDAALGAAQCGAWNGRRLGTLSGGERQRVLVARALAVDAGWLLLDEPTTHLDPPHQVAMVRMMQAQVAAGVAVVSVLHDLSLALMADHLVVMRGGTCEISGGRDDPAVHTALRDVFEGAVRIERYRERWIAVPELG